MKIKQETKNIIKQEIIKSLSREKEINKIVIFGSFIKSENPHDIDIAVYQDSNESYLDLAMKYRKLTRLISQQIPLDIIPIRTNAPHSSFLSEIETGELIYER